MQILITSPVFLPRLGGIEVMIDALARGFQNAGHGVTVATLTCEDSEPLPYPVLRCPKPVALLGVARRSDVILQNAASLRQLLPILPAGRPIAIVHHNWLPDENRLLALLRDWTLRRGYNISVSKAIAAHLPVPSKVIPLCFRGECFQNLGKHNKSYDLCCAGRFVSDKGIDLLLAALGRLAEKGIRPSLQLAGDGPERSALEALAEELNISSQVHFTGRLSASQLCAAMNDSRVLVVPSRFREPGGTIALEGAACGCYVVAADGGGMVEGLGPYGETFQRGSVDALAKSLERLVTEGLPERNPEREQTHLEAHSEARMVERYLQDLHALVGRNG